MTKNPLNTQRPTFRKQERLQSKKSIQELFSKGSHFYLYPFRIIYLKTPVEPPLHQVLISVTKKQFKRAVDRNKIRRKIREAYRLNKYRLYTDQNHTSSLWIAYIYTGKTIHSYQLIEHKLRKSIDRLVKEIS